MTVAGTMATASKIPIFDLRPPEVRTAYFKLYAHLRLGGVGAAYDFAAREQFLPGMGIAVQAAIADHRAHGRPELADKLFGMVRETGPSEIFRRAPTYDALVELMDK